MAGKNKRVVRELTPEESKRRSKNLAKVEQEKDELMALGRLLKAGHSMTAAKILLALLQEKEQQGLSLADLKERTGMERSTLSRLFKGGANSNPTVQTLERVALALGKKIKVTIE